MDFVGEQENGGVQRCSGSVIEGFKSYQIAKIGRYFAI